MARSPRSSQDRPGAARARGKEGCRNHKQVRGESQRRGDAGCPSGPIRVIVTLTAIRGRGGQAGRRRGTMLPRAVLFDFDGVLADTENIHVAAWERTFGAMGLDVP